MELTPYLESLHRELAATAAPAGPDVVRVADLLSGSLDAAARLCLLEALADATAEITSKLETATVEVRLRGRDADFVVTELAEPARPAPAAADPAADTGDLARITLRLPEPLKAQVERAAAAEGISVNAWLVRAVASAVSGQPTVTPRHGGRGRRIVGFAQA